MNKIKRLGRDRGPEIHLVTHDHVRPPLDGQVAYVPGPLERDPTGENVPDDPLLVRPVQREQRAPGGGTRRVSPPVTNAGNPASSTEPRIASWHAYATS